MATPELFHHNAQWAQVVSDQRQAVSVVDSEVGLMVDVAASVVAAEAAVDSRTEATVAEEEEVAVSRIVDLVAVTEAEAVTAVIVALVHHLQMPQLVQEVRDLALAVRHQVVSVQVGMGRAPQIVMEVLLREAQVGMILVATVHPTTTVVRMAAPEEVIVAMATVIAADIVAEAAAEAIWSQFVHATDTATEIQEITTWAEQEREIREMQATEGHHHRQEKRRAESACTMMA